MRDQVVKYLSNRGMSQAVLARACGLTEGLVSSYLSGDRNPGLRNAIKIERGTKGAIPAESWARGLKRKSHRRARSPSKKSRKAA